MSSRKRKCRPFTLLDAMILVAATAGGLALWRATLLDKTTLVYDWLSGHPVLGLVAFVYIIAVPIILVETLAVIVIRFRQPRPPLRRIMAQPGTLSCVAVLCFLLFQGTFSGPSIALSIANQGPLALVVDICNVIPSVVGSTWTVLMLSRRWCFEVGWIDTLGMVLGCYWLVGGLVSLLMFFV